jgi:hypothetical protein
MQISLWDPLSQMSCSLVSSQMPQICVICQYVVVLTPLGLHIQTCRFYSSKEPGVGSRAYIPTCLPVALDEDGGSLQLCFMLCTRKVEDLCNWIYVVILMLLQWLLLLYCGAIYWSREWHKYTGVMSFDKAGRYRMVSEHSVACRNDTLGLE